MLYDLLWTYEFFTSRNPNFVGESFEGWAYRRGFKRQLDRLEKQALIENQANKTAQRIYRLTAAGRLRALGGRDPEAAWNQAWDRKWFKISFDFPELDATARRQLRRLLLAHWCGKLQKSVYVSPRPLDPLFAKLAQHDVRSLSIFIGRPAGWQSDADYVKACWNFNEINARYAQYLERLASAPATDAEPQIIRAWVLDESQAWLDTVNTDPLLPKRLLPYNYLGKKAWSKRQRILPALVARSLDAVN